MSHALSDEPSPLVSARAGSHRRGAWFASRAAVFAVWLAAVLFMASRHAFWRDEVRALSIALNGDSVANMLRGVRGEGHPAIWYLLLRGAYDLFGTQSVLPAVALAAGMIGTLLLLFASPLPLWLCALTLSGEAFLFEFPVMARNYGISLIPLFLFAWGFWRLRERPFALGLIAAVLANTNLHSVILVGGLFLAWLGQLLVEGEFTFRKLWPWISNALAAALGIALCAVTLYPPAHDAVLTAPPGWRDILIALALPASQLNLLTVHNPMMALGLGPPPGYPASDVYRAGTLLLLCSMFGMIRWWPGMLGGAAALYVLALFFKVIYIGGYRHQALWLALVVALYWIACARGRAPWQAGGGRWIRTIGWGGLACFVVLLGLQIPAAVEELREAASGNRPISRIGDFAAALRKRPDLRDAIVIPDPDYFGETLPYYADNPIYLPRARTFSKVSLFTKEADLTLTLTQLLDEAQHVCQEQDKPVVMITEEDYENPDRKPTPYHWYKLETTSTPAEVARLHASTESLGRFAPSKLDESVDAYVLKPPCALAP